MNMEGLNKLSNKMIGIAINVHKSLGPGFVEKIYQRAMYLDLQRLGYTFRRETKIPLTYQGVTIGYQELDLIIDDKLIIETKAVSEINNIHVAQTISYLKATGCKLALILNFAQPTLQIKRLIN